MKYVRAGLHGEVACMRRLTAMCGFKRQALSGRLSAAGRGSVIQAGDKEGSENVLS